MLHGMAIEVVHRRYGSHRYVVVAVHGDVRCACQANAPSWCFSLTHGSGVLECMRPRSNDRVFIHVENGTMVSVDFGEGAIWYGGTLPRMYIYSLRRRERAWWYNVVNFGRRMSIKALSY